MQTICIGLLNCTARAIHEQFAALQASLAQAVQFSELPVLRASCKFVKSAPGISQFQLIMSAA